MNLRDKPQRGDQAKYHQTVEETDIIFCTEDTKVSFVACLAEEFHLNQFTENIRRIHIEVLSSRLEPFECNYFQILLKFCRDVSPSLQLVVVNLVLIYQQHFSHSSGKESACNAGDSGLAIPSIFLSWEIPWTGSLVVYSPQGRKSRTRLSDETTTTITNLYFY